MAHIVLIATADWDHPLWTNKQHVACELSNQGHKVLYVESLGIRSPNNTSKDFNRILKRIIKGFLPPRNVFKNIWVWSPLVIPGSSKGISLLINKIIIRTGIKIALFSIGLKYDWFWTYNPLILKFINIKRFSKTIYHAVDAIQEQPNMPKKFIQTEEINLCKNVDQVFVTSPAIEKKLQPYARKIKYQPNCCDYDHFSKALNIKSNFIPKDILGISKPIIGFFGALTNYKLDFKLISDLASIHPDWNFVFIGPLSEGEKRTNTSLLVNKDNIHLMGFRKYNQLPYYCARFDIGWLPLNLNLYTQSMFPMKFFEYLASGLPVVSTCIDSLSSFHQEALLCDQTVDSFSQAIKLTLAGQCPNLRDRLELARKYTYKSRTLEMINDINKISPYFN